MEVRGIAKLVDVEGAQRLAENSYWGIGTSGALQAAFGWLEIALGAMVVVGFMGRIT